MGGLMSEELTPRQQIVLWDLVSRNGSALMKELKPELKPADREPLKKAGYISVSKDGRSLRLTLEEAGWNYLSVGSADLSKSIGSKYDRPILQFVLQRVQDFARQGNIALAKILANPGNREVGADPENFCESENSIEQAIRNAFFEIAGRPPRDRVRLSALRAQLSHVARAELDGTLLSMRKSGKVNLTNLDNPRDIEAEKEAALQNGLLTFHTVWIDE
jgi:hypothetical protein